MTDCIFCKIIDGKIPAEIIFENEDVLAFRDIQSQAREHFLFIHKTHQRPSHIILFAKFYFNRNWFNNIPPDKIYFRSTFGSPITNIIR